MSTTLHDPASHANFTQVQIRHVHLKLSVNMESKEIDAEVDYDIEVLDSAAKLVNLDSRDCEIHSVTINQKPAQFSYAVAEKEYKGGQLSIELPQPVHEHDIIHMKIMHLITTKCQALQWMTKEQTIDKVFPTDTCLFVQEYPLVFTYNQPIGARALIPCMDTPSVKSTISYQLAEQIFGGFRFRSRPTYWHFLLAIMCPPIFRREFESGPSLRCFKKQLLNLAQYFWSFGERYYLQTEEQLKLAESILGEFVWQRADLVVLPYSFPFGGMENPSMIFLTPTLLAGDRSLVHLVTHELVHSWCGNLVTNATWEHMWLNEGFTTYFELRVMDQMFSATQRDFCCLNNWSQNMLPTVHHFPRWNIQIFEQFSPEHPWTAMVQDHSKEGDPISAFSMIYYEKGQVFLHTLENIFGRKEFDAWFHEYLKKFSRKSLNSEQWKKHFCAYFEAKGQKALLDKIDFQKWMYGVGLPPEKPKYDDSLQRECQAYADLWANSSEAEAAAFTNEAFEKFNTHQKIEFISLLRNHTNAMSEKKMEIIQDKLNLFSITNIEIEYLFILTGLRARWRPIVPRAKAFIEKNGRLKLSRPVFRELLAWDETRKDTCELFHRIRPQMHPLGVEFTILELKKFGLA